MRVALRCGRFPGRREILDGLENAILLTRSSDVRSEDENDRLDLNDVSHVAIGLHGTAKAVNASGVIMVSDVQFVP